MNGWMGVNKRVINVWRNRFVDGFLDRIGDGWVDGWVYQITLISQPFFKGFVSIKISAAATVFCASQFLITSNDQSNRNSVDNSRR